MPLEVKKGCGRGLLKMHKEGIPLRPIVGTIEAPTYGLHKYLMGLLKPMVGMCDHHVKNSKMFAIIVDVLRISPSDILCEL